MQASEQIQVISLDEGAPLPIVNGEGSAHAVIWPGMGAQLRSIHRIELARGARTVNLRHPSEAVYYVMQGSGKAIDPDSRERQELRRGSMVHIDRGTAYVLSAGNDGILLVGGPSPPDAAMYEEVT